MKKLVVVGAGVVGAMGLALLGAGVATADDVEGQTYAKARAMLAEQGMGAIVASTVGDRAERDDCIVTSATRANFLDSSGDSAGNNMLVNLNCYATHGSATGPGYSLASPQGRESFQAEQAELAKQEAAAKAAQEQAELAELAAAGAPQAGE